jgi:hypothetical protein
MHNSEMNLPKYAPRRALAFVLLLLLTFIGIGALLIHGSSKPTRAAHPALARLPVEILWAWQRPEDLRELPRHMGVAYVATSISVENTVATVLPRQHPLYVKPHTAIVPVVHVDASWRDPPSLNAVQRDAIVGALLRAARLGNSNVVQLDFEVRRSQRVFLTSVIESARQQLPPDIALSVTALASWCAGDDWLGSLPVDEVVPMAFRMARGDGEIRALLASHGRFIPAHCQTALGTATDEPLLHMHKQIGAGGTNKKIRHYYFSPKPWIKTQWER